MTNKMSFYIGSLVMWNDALGKLQSGVVVKERIYQHSPMSSYFTVWSDTHLDGSFVEISPYSGITIVKPSSDEDKNNKLKRANKRIAEKFSQYPIWKERIDNGQASELFAEITE